MTEARMHIVKSAHRVLEVLEYFDEHKPAATVTDIARALSYPQSSTSVLLRCLRETGYLYYNRFSRTYRPTTRVALLGYWAEDGNYHGGRMMELIDNIADRCGDTVMLTCGNVDYTVQVLHVVRGYSPDAIVMRKGACGSILHNLQGELGLSSYPDPQIRLALHRLNAEQSSAERRVNINEKLVEMRAMRVRGWAMGENENGTGTVSVFMPRRKGGDRLVVSVVVRANVVAARGQEILTVMLEERDRLFGQAAARELPFPAGGVQPRQLEEHLV